MSRSEDQLGFFEAIGTLKTTPDNPDYVVGAAIGLSLVMKGNSVGAVSGNISGVRSNKEVVYIIEPTRYSALSGSAKGSFEIEIDPQDFGIPQLKHLAGVQLEYENLYDVAIEVFRKYHPSLEFESVGRAMVGDWPSVRLYSLGQQFKVRVTGNTDQRDKGLIRAVALMWKPSDKRGIYGNTYGKVGQTQGS